MTGGSQADGVRVAACSGEFDRDTVPVPADVCEREAGAAELLVLDVARVTFAGSAFLNLMIRLHRTRPLVLEGPLPHQLFRRLEPSGALGLFEVRGTERVTDTTACTDSCARPRVAGSVQRNPRPDCRHDGDHLRLTAAAPATAAFVLLEPMTTEAALTSLNISPGSLRNASIGRIICVRWTHKRKRATWRNRRPTA